MTGKVIGQLALPLSDRTLVEITTALCREFPNLEMLPGDGLVTFYVVQALAVPGQEARERAEEEILRRSQVMVDAQRHAQYGSGTAAC